jgi:rhamnosyltransferase
MINDSVSVIIRTKNEERWIGYAVQSVLTNLKKPEIIIVDNNSTDETLNIIGLFTQDKMLGDKKNRNYTNIKIFKIDDYTPGKALNLGVKKSTKNMILVLSAHCQLQKINFKKHQKDLEKFDCVFGKQDPVYKGKKVIKRYLWSHFKDKRAINMYSEYEKRYFLHNALAMYKRKTLMKNKFNESLVAKEDRYWANNLIKKKKKILYDPDLSAVHHYTDQGNTWKGLA